jgi:hypothetical protein
MKSIHALPAITLTLFALAATAQTQAPGLWEHSFTMKAQGAEMARMQAQMEAQLAALPPEQRRQIDDMMKRRGVSIGAQGAAVKFCLAKEQAARPASPPMTGDCKPTDLQRSGSTMRYRFACTQPQPVSGEGEITYSSDKAYTGRSSLTTQVQGRAQQVEMAMAGKWLGADCGEVQPAAAPSAR